MDAPLDYGGLTTEQEIMRKRMEMLREQQEANEQEPIIEQLTDAQPELQTMQKNEHDGSVPNISPTEFIAVLVKSARTPLDWLILIIIIISIAISLDVIISSLFREYARRDGGSNFCKTCGGVV